MAVEVHIFFPVVSFLLKAIMVAYVLYLSSLMKYTIVLIVDMFPPPPTSLFLKDG